MAIFCREMDFFSVLSYPKMVFVELACVCALLVRPRSKEDNVNLPYRTYWVQPIVKPEACKWTVL